VEGRLWFSKVLDLQKLTGRFLGHWTLLGDGPVNQLSDTKLIVEASEHKSITARFFMFGFYQVTRKVTKYFVGMVSMIKTNYQLFF
jgi:hypothetical protein